MEDGNIKNSNPSCGLPDFSNGGFEDSFGKVWCKLAPKGSSSKNCAHAGMTPTTCGCSDNCWCKLHSCCDSDTWEAQADTRTGSYPVLTGAPINMCTDGLGNTFPDPTNANVRKFESGATRDTSANKHDVAHFISARVTKRYCEFMHRNRFQSDGSIRAGNNWARGIPTEVYLQSLTRHTESVKLILEGYPEETAENLEDALCAVIFNASGMLLEELKKDKGTK